MCICGTSVEKVEDGVLGVRAIGLEVAGRKMSSATAPAPEPVPPEVAAYFQKKQRPDSTYHRLFAAAIAIIAIVVMVLVWFAGLVFQVVNFVLAFLIFALGIIIAMLPIKCVPCSCD
jgi:hypothetical protein